MKIKDINKDDRPREKLIKKGVDSLSDTELLAILLRCGSKERSALDIASDLIGHENGIKELLNMNYEEISKVNGIKESKACIILSAFELCKRAIKFSSDDISYDNAEKLYNRIKPSLKNKRMEELYVIYLDSKLKIMKEKLYDIGGVKNIIIPRERIIREAITIGAYAVCIAHNHPSGDPSPSDSDIKLTLELKEAFNILNICLIDHLIIGDNAYYSFSNELII